MDSTITLQLTLTLGREQLPIIKQIVDMAQAYSPLADDEDLPPDDVTPEEAAQAITESTPEVLDILDDLDLEPKSVWSDEALIEAVRPCVQENKDKAKTWLELYATGHGFKATRMRDVPVSRRGEFVTGMYNYFGREYNGVA